MTKKITTSIIVFAFVLGFAGQASAQSLTTGANVSVGATTDGTSANTNTSVGSKIKSMLELRGGRASTSASISTSNESSAKTKADTAITARVDALNKLGARAAAMVKVSASTKASVAAEIQTETSNLSSLKAKIDADTDLSILKTDLVSITGGYRIYALVIPQGAILVASDRAETVASTMTTVGTKLQARITAAQAAGANVSSLQSTYADFTAKVSDSNTKSAAAISATASLTPDNGTATVAASNKQALENGRASLKTSVADLKTAYADAKSIVSALQSMKVAASSTTNVQ